MGAAAGTCALRGSIGGLMISRKTGRPGREACASACDLALANPEIVDLPGQAGAAGQACLAAVPLARLDTSNRDFRQIRERARARLAMLLLSRWKPEPGGEFWGRDVQIAHDDYGKPHLVGSHPPYPAVSFSYGSSSLWGALGKPGLHLGLDAAEAAEFPEGYPYHRLAAAGEWAEIRERLALDGREAAALGWAAKEATVKALGCGYRGIGPRQVILAYQGRWAGAVLFQARVEAEPKPGFPGLPGATAAVIVHRRQRTWLALGLTFRSATSRPSCVRRA